MTNDLQLPPELRPIEDRLRSALFAVAATTPELDERPVDVVALPEVPRPRRSPRRWIAAAAAAAAALTIPVANDLLPLPGTTVAIDDEASTTTSSTPSSSTETSPAADYFLPSSLPAGLRPAAIGRLASPVRATSRVEVYAEGAHADRAVGIVRTDEPALISTILSFDRGTRITIAGKAATSASSGVLRGIDLSTAGGGLAVIGRGLSADEVRSIADVVARTGAPDGALPDRFTRIYDGRHPFIHAAGDDVVTARFASDDGLREIELTTITGAAVPPWESVGWHLEGPGRVLGGVRGPDVLSVRIGDPDGGPGVRQLIWSEANVLITLTGRNVSEDELIETARSLAPASKAEIDELIAQSEASLSED
ncbi:MAG TPA: hypothetical protein VM345_12775 [Acidimicrobiales bacterium]|nr:hypothetical protein [Acidimicrobiales bacterium]